MTAVAHETIGRGVLRRGLRRPRRRARPGAARDLRRRHRADRLARARGVAGLRALARHRPGSDLLDVACGSGGPALQLVRETGASVVGVDVHEDAIALAGIAARAEPRASFRRTDAAPAAVRGRELRRDRLHRRDPPLPGPRGRARRLAPAAAARRRRALHRPGRRDRASSRARSSTSARRSGSSPSRRPASTSSCSRTPASTTVRCEDATDGDGRVADRWERARGRHVQALEWHEGRDATSRRSASCVRRRESPASGASRARCSSRPTGE